jgi:hypothetical protein
MQKAQMFSEDMVFALFILIFLFSLFFVVTDKVTSTITVTEDRSELDEVASIAINQLLETSGNPSNWNLLGDINESNVQSMGLVADKKVLDADKVQKFFNLTSDSNSYNSTKILLGLTRKNYKFNATIYSLNGVLLYSINATPSYTTTEYAAINNMAKIDRYALLNNSLVKFSLGVWSE